MAQRVQSQNENRREWSSHDTPENLAEQILEESGELVDAIRNFDALPHAEYEVVSEVGDILYLALKFCVEMGIDPAQAVELKLARNSVKYPDEFHSNGWDYDKAREVSKSLWEHLGGDDAFFLWHSLLYPVDETT